MKKVEIVLVTFATVLSIGLWGGCSKQQGGIVTVRYGITPYQETALPMVPEELGWYKEAGIKFEPVPVGWGDVISSMSGGAIDVVVYNFNSFQPPYENAMLGSAKPVFYCPMFMFKGQAIMIRTNSGLEVFREAAGEPKEARERRIASVAAQLKGKRIAITEGTELEQIVLATLKKAGLTKEDVKLIHASPEDSLAAFIAGNVDAFAAGLTERVESRRHGGTELLVTADVMLPVIDGLVTTEAFAKAHPETVDKLVQMWFRTIRFMEQDLTNNCRYVLTYLSKAASTRYTPEEYAVAWTFNLFPKDAKEAEKLFSDPSSIGYWKTSWDANNQFLLQQGKIKAAVPDSAYWGDGVMKRLSRE